MKKFINILFLLTPFIVCALDNTPVEIARYNQQARAVTIIRDSYGTPHIYAKTDAGVVFGLMYTQCEENFKGIERNYLYQLGRQSEADGATPLYTDVQLQLIADSADAINDYYKSPPAFRKLLDAFADGVNYYLYKHPGVKPLVFKKFKPWFALMFTDGSVAATETGDITPKETEAFYGSAENTLGATVLNPASILNTHEDRETGSNGFAISPSRTASGHAMLYINPHVPFYFRSEVGLESGEGLHAYGAVTWGQFFIYQGFNKHCGWMHTSSYADVGDVYAEKVIKKNGNWFYEYDGKLKPVTIKKLTLKVKKDNELIKTTINAFYTHHGPVLAARGGKWLALRHFNRSYKALLESWLITKADNYAAYEQAMMLLANTSNNTVYADDKGNTAFWYGDFMPRRNPVINWAIPVDGSTSATEWKGLHPLNELVQVHNPAAGFIQNCNSSPFTSAGASSPVKTKYPLYMAPNDENYRGLNAISLFKNARGLTLDGLIAKGYDHYLTLFDDLLPALFAAYDKAPDSLKTKLSEPISILKQWDRRTAVNSVASTLAVEWGTLFFRAMPPADPGENSYQVKRVRELLASLSGDAELAMLSTAIDDLKSRFGTWKMPWGEVNRYQRPAAGAIFDDAAPSLPVGLTSSNFGQLPSFQSRVMPGTKKRYGFSGNSFIAAVEFGPVVKAKTIITGGHSFDPSSPNFTDQAEGYINGRFKDVLFYRSDVLKHAVQTYHP